MKPNFGGKKGRPGNLNGQSVKPPRVTDVMGATMRCPSNHALPHKTQNGECTPLYCAADEQDASAKRVTKKTGEAVRAAKKKVRDVKDGLIEAIVPGGDPASEVMRVAAKEERISEAGRLGRAAGRFASRLSLVKVPAGLEGDAAEQWARAQLKDALPEAVAEIRFQLKYGSDPQRAEMAEKVLDANGMGKQAQNFNGMPLIIVAGQAPDGGLSFPWVRKPKALAQVVDVTPEPAPDAKKQH